MLANMCQGHWSELTYSSRSNVWTSIISGAGPHYRGQLELELELNSNKGYVDSYFAFCDNPIKGAVYMEAELAHLARQPGKRDLAVLLVS